MNMISRRHMVKGLAAGLPLAVVLADPLLARVAAGGAGNGDHTRRRPQGFRFPGPAGEGPGAT